MRAFAHFVLRRGHVRLDSTDGALRIEVNGPLPTDHIVIEVDDATLTLVDNAAPAEQPGGDRG